MDEREILHTRRDWLWLAAIVFAGLLPRLLLVWITKSVIDSDEAIVGLMAKHITEGKPWPIFYYGQNYMGSLEGIMAALSFLIFGRSNFTLKLVPLVFSLVHICLVYALARRFVDRFCARIAALLTAIAPSALVLWSTMARGGFIEIVVIGTLSLIISIDLLTGRITVSKKSMFFLGLILGLGWWVNNQIIFYIAAIGFVFCLHFLHSFGFFRSMRFACTMAVGFVLGGLPFWYANVLEQPRWATFSELLYQHPTTTSFTDHLSGFFREALPIIFGARHFWSESDIFPHATLMLYAIHGLTFLVVFAVCVGTIWPARRRDQSESPLPYCLLLLFCCAVCLLFSASSFGWLSKAPRYLLPLYSVLYVFTAIVVNLLRKASSFLLYVLSWILVLLIIGAHLASNYAQGIAVPGQPFIYKGQRVMVNHEPLYQWLRDNNYTHIRTNYWVGYRTAFETNEEITFTRFGSPRTLRIREYERGKTEDDFQSVYVLTPLEAAAVARSFDKFGLVYRRSEVGGYAVIDQVHPIADRGKQITLLPEQIAVSSRPDWAKGMIDGSLSTRWGSGMPQHSGMTVEVALGKAMSLSGLDIDLGAFPQDAPRRLVIQGLGKDKNWYDLFDSNGTFYDLNQSDLGEFPKDWQIVFTPRCLMAIRLTQQGKTEVFDWSIAELRIYAAAQAHVNDCMGE
jgi:hypothetical protein